MVSGEEEKKRETRKYVSNVRSPLLPGSPWDFFLYSSSPLSSRPYQSLFVPPYFLQPPSPPVSPSLTSHLESSVHQSGLIGTDVEDHRVRTPGEVTSTPTTRSEPPGYFGWRNSTLQNSWTELSRLGHGSGIGNRSGQVKEMRKGK